MIYIIRHGKTDLNRARVLQGRSNYPLNKEGVREAQQAAEALQGIRFSHVFSSPLTRAVQTAQIVAPYLAPVIDERLIEMEYGPWEGLGLDRLAPEVLSFFRDFVHTPAPTGMEQLSSVVARGGAFLEEIRGLPGDILISTHAVAMKGLLEYLTPESRGSYWPKPIGNCAVYAAKNENGTFGVPFELT
ncbi:MAG: histidine phosphatase family protein [Lachnospiraceae bacterium]|nr:histidine phosphatase family protein [Lachnospiraceae bacterium]